MIQREFVRFLAVGITNTAFSYSLYLLLNLVVPYRVAWTLAYVAGILFSYYLNARWVFKKEMHWKSFSSFPLVYGVQYLLGLLFLQVLVEHFGISEKLAPAIVIVLTIPVTFVLSRLVIRMEKQIP